MKSDILHHPNTAFNLNSDGILVYSLPPSYKEDSQQRKLPSRKDIVPPLSKIFERSPSKVRELRETFQPQTEAAAKCRGKVSPSLTPAGNLGHWAEARADSSLSLHLTPLLTNICPAQNILFLAISTVSLANEQSSMFQSPSSLQLITGMT